MASSDLGGLGSKEGTLVAYDWVLPGVAPLLLPWLIILGLLALRPNRCASAWLIWLPLACIYVLTLTPPPFLPEGTGFVLDGISALAVGLAAIWLLSDYLKRQHRLLTFLCVLFALAGFSLLAALAKLGVSLLSIESLQTGIVLAVGVLASAMALSLAGLICRGRQRPIGLYAWLFLLLAGIWLLIAAPFFVIALVAFSGGIRWSEFFIPVFAAATVNYMLLLPFLILSSASPFFRERLKALLNVKPSAPPLISPLPDANLKT